MKWIARAKYLDPPITDDLVGTVIQHFNMPIAMAPQGRQPRTTNNLLAILMELEEYADYFNQSRGGDNEISNNASSPQNFQGCNNNHICNRTDSDRRYCNIYTGWNNNNQNQNQSDNQRLLDDHLTPIVNQLNISENNQGTPT